jgi:hypothetical protein
MYFLRAQGRYLIILKVFFLFSDHNQELPDVTATSLKALFSLIKHILGFFLKLELSQLTVHCFLNFQEINWSYVLMKN